VVSGPSVNSLAACLSIPAHFLTHASHPTVHVAYECYKGCLEAQDRLDTMVSLGEWTGKVPILEEVIKLFVPKSTWYNYYCKAFSDLEDYPDLFKYLERADNAPQAKDLFRTRKLTYSYTDIIDYQARCDCGGNQQKRKGDNHGEGSSKAVKKVKVDLKTSTKKVEPKRKSGGRDRL
jgi:hypothetical protein